MVGWQAEVLNVNVNECKEATETEWKFSENCFPLLLELWKPPQSRQINFEILEDNWEEMKPHRIGPHEKYLFVNIICSQKREVAKLYV